MNEHVARLLERVLRLPAPPAHGASAPVSPPTPDPQSPYPALEGQRPIALLPVRLETRFVLQDGAPVLWIRVYPDDLHVDRFDASMTPQELGFGTEYLKRIAGADREGRRALWAAFVDRIGSAPRASWITSILRQIPPERVWVRKDGWNDPPIARCLPSAFRATAWQGDRRIFDVTGAAVPDVLAVGPSPHVPPGGTDEGMKWTVDFPRAVAQGMGLVAPLDQAEPGAPITRLLVYGVRSKIWDANHDDVLDLFRTHRFTDGLAFLSEGTPTNNTPDVPSGFSSRDPDHAASFEAEEIARDEHAGTLHRPPPGSSGERFVRAIGLPPFFDDVAGASGGEERFTRAMHFALWPATWGYYLDQMAGSRLDPTTIEMAKQLAIEWARPAGPLPVLRIGRQPYGLLPVTSLKDWIASQQPDDPQITVAKTLESLRVELAKAIPNVPRVTPGAAAIDDVFTKILGMTERANAVFARSVLGGAYAQWLFDYLRMDPTSETNRWDRVQADTAGPLEAILGVTPENRPRLVGAAYSRDVFAIGERIVSEAVPDYLSRLVDPARPMTLEGLLRMEGLEGGAGRFHSPLLWLLVRHSLLVATVKAARGRVPGAVDGALRWEEELGHLDPADSKPTVWEALRTPGPDGRPLGESVFARQGGALSEMYDAIAVLASAGDPEVLDRALSSALELASFRLDAWIGAIAHRQLLSSPGRKTGGSHAGAWGVVEELRPPAVFPDPSNPVPERSPASQGWLLAPSPSHAATAAVLRAGWFSHGADAGSPLGIDLSSEAMRTASDVFDAARAGRPPAGVLGQRLERALVEAGLPAAVPWLRERWPLPRDPTADGIAILRAWQTAPGTVLAVIAPAKVDAARFSGVMDSLAPVLRAVADASLAESVHAIVHGDHPKAAATLDAISSGDVPPPRLELAHTPRRAWSASHRLLVALPPSRSTFPGPHPPPGGWVAMGPRALAEPRLEMWLESVFGPPERIQAHVEWMGLRPGLLRAPDAFPLSSFGLSALDVLAMALEGGDEIERRVLLALPAQKGMRPRVRRDRAPEWPPSVTSVAELVQLATAVRTAIDAAQPLERRHLEQSVSAEAAFDTAELAGRADAAVAALAALPLGASNPAAMRAALMSASRFGFRGVLPDREDDSTLPAKLAAAAAERARRQSALATRASAFKPGSASPRDRVEYDTGRLRDVFGTWFRAVPLFDAGDPGAAMVADMKARAPEATGKLHPAHAFVQRAARTRDPVAAYSSMALLSQMTASQAPRPLGIAQLPADGAPWAGTAGARAAAGRLSLVVDAPVELGPGRRLAGLAFDEWSETTPDDTGTAGLAFHHDRPNARAPQAILLAVSPSASVQRWTPASLEQILLETIELAKLRAIDADLLPELGHYLPAALFGLNLRNDTISTNFTVATPDGGIDVEAFEAPPPPSPVPGASRLEPGQEMQPDSRLLSPNGRFFLVMQGDGNLVIYDTQSGALWSSGTYGQPGNVCSMDGDGALGVYDGTSGEERWISYSGATENIGAHLEMRDDGNIAIVKDGRVAWQTYVTLPPVELGSFAIRVSNHQYVSAENGGGGRVAATANFAGANETFTMLDVHGGQVAFRCIDGRHWLGIGASAIVTATATARGATETFQRVDTADGQLHLRASNGSWISAEGGGGRELIANRPNPLGWETFQLFDPATAPGTGPYYQYSFERAIRLEETDASYDFLVDPDRNLWVIKRANTGTRTTEVHVLTAASEYQEFSVHSPTALEETGYGRDSWQFLIDRYGNLYAIKKNGTGSGHTEVHVLSRDGDWSEFSDHAVTALGETDGNWSFALGPGNDLYAVQRVGTASGMAELTILSGASRWSEQTRPTFALGLDARNARWEIMMPFVDTEPDLWAVKTTATGTRSTEIHVLSYGSDYQGFNRQQGSAWPECDESCAFAVASNLDVFVVKKVTGSGWTELHVLWSGN